MNLSVPAGSVYGLLGPNGSGKSTTIKILMNLLTPTDGQAEVLGRWTEKLAWSDFQKIAYVSEDQVMPDEMKVGELLEYLTPYYPTWDSALCEELRRQLDLPLGPSPQKPFAWDEDESSAAGVARVPARADHPRRALQRTRSGRARGLQPRSAQLRFRGEMDRLSLLARCRGSGSGSAIGSASWRQAGWLSPSRWTTCSAVSSASKSRCPPRRRAQATGVQTSCAWRARASASSCCISASRATRRLPPSAQKIPPGSLVENSPMTLREIYLALARNPSVV